MKGVSCWTLLRISFSFPESMCLASSRATAHAEGSLLGNPKWVSPNSTAQGNKSQNLADCGSSTLALPSVGVRHQGLENCVDDACWWWLPNGVKTSELCTQKWHRWEPSPVGHACNPRLGQQRQDDQKIKVLHSYINSSRPSFAA